MPAIHITSILCCYSYPPVHTLSLRIGLDGNIIEILRKRLQIDPLLYSVKFGSSHISLRVHPKLVLIQVLFVTRSYDCSFVGGIIGRVLNQLVASLGSPTLVCVPLSWFSGLVEFLQGSADVLFAIIW